MGPQGRENGQPGQNRSPPFTITSLTTTRCDGRQRTWRRTVFNGGREFLIVVWNHTHRIHGGLALSAAVASARLASRPDEKIIKYRLITKTPLTLPRFTKKPMGRIRPCPRLLCSILSFSRAFSVGALCTEFVKSRRSPSSLCTILFFSRADSLMHCAYAEGRKKKQKAKTPS